MQRMASSSWPTAVGRSRMSCFECVDVGDVGFEVEVEERSCQWCDRFGLDFGFGFASAVTSLARRGCYPLLYLVAVVNNRMCALPSTPEDSYVR
jgi:hypothetical protein